MTRPRNAVPDATRTRIRAIVAEIDLEISRLPSIRTSDGNGTPTSALFASWAELVDKLGLGPEREAPKCPVCRRSGVRAHTRCWHCWMLDEVARRT